MEELVRVRNRNSGSTSYTIKETGIRRNFAPGEEKKIPLAELKQLQYIPGGDYLLKNMLIVNDENALDILNMTVEPEYFYTEAEIKELLEHGTLEQLEDTLTFGKESSGVIELIKKIAVDIEVPDTRKRKLISEATGFSIDNAININHILNDEDENAEKKEDAAPKRKAAPIKVAESGEKVRKTVKPTYKVVSKEE